MKFQTHSDPAQVSYAGSQLQGSIMATMNQLRTAFGEPIRAYDDGLLDGDGKVPIMWLLEFEDGLVATIYLYRTRVIPFPNVTWTWHIGGITERCKFRVHEAFRERLGLCQRQPELA